MVCADFGTCVLCECRGFVGFSECCCVGFDFLDFGCGFLVCVGIPAVVVGYIRVWFGL